MILETERLYLREMNQNDYGDLAEILQNPKVIYAYEHDFSDNDVQEWLDRQVERYKKYGFGLWAVILKNTGDMIGQAGLTIQPYKVVSSNQPVLSYRQYSLISPPITQSHIFCIFLLVYQAIPAHHYLKSHVHKHI